MTLEAWWTHAIFYAVDPHGFQDADGNGTGDLKGLTKQLDYIHSIGVDAITLTHYAPTQGDTAARLQTIDPAVGTLDDFDELVREASRDSLRLIVELDPQQLPDPSALSAAARFWLGRGAAGISLRAGATEDPQRAAQLQKLHQVTRSFAGQRILIGEVAAGASSHADVDMTLNPVLAAAPQFNAASLRAALEHLQGASESTAISATDLPGMPRSTTRYGDGTNDAAIAKVLATALLATRANAQIFYGQEIGMSGKPAEALMPWGVAVDPAATKKPTPTVHGPEVAAEEADGDSVLNWYRRLIDLHHGNATMRSSTIDLVNHDEQNVLMWVSRKQAITPLAPAIIVLCNLSAKPVKLSLTDDIRNLHLRGNFLRTVLRSDQGMGGMSLDAVTLPPFEIYIGELRF
jgi:glycosidase